MSYGISQKTCCPTLVLLRSPSAKERFCRNTYANADEMKRKSDPERITLISGQGFLISDAKI